MLRKGLGDDDNRPIIYPIANPPVIAGMLAVAVALFIRRCSFQGPNK